MTSGGNHFNYFLENELTKFKLCPSQLPYFCPPRISVTHFVSPVVPLDAPVRDAPWFVRIVDAGAAGGVRRFGSEQMIRLSAVHLRCLR